jgi:hypothetical protein
MIHRREPRTKMFHYPNAAGWKILSMTLKYNSGIVLRFFEFRKAKYLVTGPYYMQCPNPTEFKYDLQPFQYVVKLNQNTKNG